MSKTEKPEDALLMQHVVDGDRQAFIALYDKYSARVYGLAFRILGDEMTSEEVVQDAFLRLWTRADTFDPNRGKLSSWLLTITHRLALDRIRLEARRPILWNPSNPETTIENIPDPISQADESRWASLKFALAELPEEQRTVIELSYYYKMSHSQIADHQSIPLGTVKTRLRLGMEKLRRQWK